MRTSVRLLIAIVAVVAFVAFARAWTAYGIASDGRAATNLVGESITIVQEGLRSAGAGVGLLLLGSWLFGRLSKMVGLPKLSGYLIFGILVGPSVLSLVTKEQLPYLRLINDLAISVIALTAGGEIDLKALRARAGAVASVTTFVVVAVFAAVFGSAALFPGAYGFEATSQAAVLALAALLGVLATANSPAVLVALITETGSRGPFSQVALAATVVKDLVLVTLFAIVFAFAAPVLTEATGGQEGLPLRIARELGGSVIAGGLVGVLLSWYIHKVGSHLPIVVVLGGFGISVFAEAMHFEPLLVALIAGLLMRNLWPRETEPLFEAIENLSLPVYCVFFAVAGAKLDLSLVPEVWTAALLLIGVRAAATWVGVTAGAALGRSEPHIRNLLWTAFIPQAGVALALASIVDKALTGTAVGEGFFSLVVIAMGVHEVVGPIILRWGMARADEVESEAPGGDGAPASGEGGDAAPPDGA